MKKDTLSNGTELAKIIIVLMFIVPMSLKAQPFTKKYIMSYHTCGTGCTGFTDHLVNLAESNDGINWTTVPNFTSYLGSVPDVIIRRNKLYLYNPGKVKRYNNSTGLWDITTSKVTIIDSIGGNVNFVDPSAIIDNSGKIVLFYLNSSGIPMGQDPAGCSTYPCIKRFDSATEVDGSDGTQFLQNSGHRASFTLTSTSTSDPDIYYDGSKYILYISKGTNTYAYQCNTLNGTYTAMPNLTNGLLTSQGGIPCGYYDPTSNKYWTYVHANVSGSTVIRQAIHSNFNSQLTTFNTVISASIMAKPTGTTTESPGFCTNDFLVTSLSKKEITNINIFPNPTSDLVTLELKDVDYRDMNVEIQNTLGQRVFFQTLRNVKNYTIDLSKYAVGVYSVSLNIDNAVFYNKKLILQR